MRQFNASVVANFSRASQGDRISFVVLEIHRHSIRFFFQDSINMKEYTTEYEIHLKFCRRGE
jgi:hypothetical protein